MSLAQLFPILIAAHVMLAVSLLLPSVLLPLTMRLRPAGAAERRGRVSRAMYWLQGNGTLIVGAGLALTGFGLILALGPQLFNQPWLLIALGLYTANLLLAFFIQRPGLARLIRLRTDVNDESRARWQDWARRQRYVSYVMAGLVGVIAFLMMSKPQL